MAEYKDFCEEQGQDLHSVHHPDFPALVDQKNGWSDAAELVNGERFTVMASAMSYVLRYCWQRPNGKRRNVKGACSRFTALAMLIRPDLFPDETFKSVAKELRVTRALLSKLSLEFSGRVGLHFRFNQHVSGMATKCNRIRRQAYKS